MGAYGPGTVADARTAPLGRSARCGAVWLVVRMGEGEVPVRAAWRLRAAAEWDRVRGELRQHRSLGHRIRRRLARGSHRVSRRRRCRRRAGCRNAANPARSIRDACAAPECARSALTCYAASLSVPLVAEQTGSPVCMLQGTLYNDATPQPLQVRARRAASGQEKPGLCPCSRRRPAGRAALRRPPTRRRTATAGLRPDVAVRTPRPPAGPGGTRPCLLRTGTQPGSHAPGVARRTPKWNVNRGGIPDRPDRV